VGSAVPVGLVAGLTVAVPVDIPAVALRAAPVYRLEVGAALFGGLYVVSMTFVLALRNRGFTDIGTAGVRAHDLGHLPEAIVADRRALAELATLIAELKEGSRDGGD
jgi:hypothetical protein